MMDTEKLLKETAVSLPTIACQVCHRRDVTAIVHGFMGGECDSAVCRSCADRIQKVYAGSIVGNAHRLQLALKDCGVSFGNSLPKPVAKFLHGLRLLP